MKGCCFVVDSEGLADEFWFFLKDCLYVGYVFLLDVPVEILVPCVGVSKAFDCSHPYNNFSFYQTIQQ